MFALIEWAQCILNLESGQGMVGVQTSFIRMFLLCLLNWCSKAWTGPFISW